MLFLVISVILQALRTCEIPLVIPAIQEQDACVLVLMDKHLLLVTDLEMSGLDDVCSYCIKQCTSKLSSSCISRSAALDLF